MGKQAICLKSGQIVRIRNRLWRIDSIYKNELIATSIDNYQNFQKRFYIPFETITLAEMGLPDISKLGDLNKQELLNTAYKISLIHGSSPLMSLQRASVIPINFQLVPVIMALNNVRTRLLIADDVGLGKTIEAGLIVTELMARQLARKILVICPANLREQWQEALLYFFKLDFRIISSLHRKYLEKELPIGISPWEYFPKLITSVDYAKSKAMRNEILNYDWDLVIVDEAHLCARPHQTSDNSSTTMQRWELLKKISTKTKHLILATATPHNGYSDTFASLIEVLDINATLPNDLSFIDKDIAKKHVCQRRRKDVVKWIEESGEGFNPFPYCDPLEGKKEIRINSLSKLEIGIYKKLSNYGKQMTELAKNSNTIHLSQFVVLHFLKRSLSSPAALHCSLSNRIKKLGENEYSPEITDSVAKASIAETDQFENLSVEEVNYRIERTIFSIDSVKAELVLLEDILKDVKKIKPTNDSKYKKLINETIPELFNNYPKIIIFTRYIDTLSYLKNNLEKVFSDTNIVSIHGQMNAEQRKEALSKFEKSEKSILLATDCIAEGMNLQYLCSQIIHYELPWNPNRLEQRNGRVDRFGQPNDVYIRTMIIENTLDDYILKKIIERADRMKEECGFTPPFFADENAIINRLIEMNMTPATRSKKDENQFNIFDYMNSKEELLSEDDPLENEEFKKKINNINNESFYGQTDISLPDVERKLRETVKTIGSKEEVERFIRKGLDEFKCSCSQNNDGTYTIKITDKRLIIPGTPDEIKKATFDKEFAAKHPYSELIDLSHPLVNRLVNVIKQQFHIDSDSYGRTACKVSNAIKTPIAILKVLVRYVVETQPSSVIEEIMNIGFEIYTKRILSSEEIKTFEDSPANFGQRTAAEFKEDISELIDDTFWRSELEAKIENYRKQIIEERKHLLETLNYDSELPDWIKGVEKISLASYDIITITAGYPL